MNSRSRFYPMGAIHAASIACFAALASTVMLWDEADQLDVRFVRWVHDSSPPGLVEAMQVLTHAGSGLFLGPLALAATFLLVRRGRPAAAGFVVATFVASHVVSQLLKFTFQRARPEFDDPFVQLSTFAFPSGHALGATATYGALAITIASAHPRRRAAAATIAASAVLLVAASRVILGVHYLLDVAAGIAAGIAVLTGLLLGFALAPRYRAPVPWFRRDEQPQGPRLDP